MRNVLVLSLALLWFAPASATAAQIQVDDLLVASSGTLRQGIGGEFRLTTAPGSPHAFDSFLTFCVQTSEHIAPNSSTVYRVMGIATSTLGLTSKALDPRAAWLFEQFSLGLLDTHPQFDYTTAAHAEQLQKAIWRFMGEPGYGGESNQFTTYFDTLSNVPAGIGNVRVLNLVNADDGTPAQDQLVYVQRVPEPATLVLLGAGLAGLAARMRRRR